MVRSYVGRPNRADAFPSSYRWGVWISGTCAGQEVLLGAAALAALMGSVLCFNNMQLMGEVSVVIAAGAGTGIVTGPVVTAIV